MITEPGIYDLPAADYHADPVAAMPSLSSSLARLLLDRSPLHARLAHPRLTPGAAPEPEDRFDLGTAAHAYVLDGLAPDVVVDAPDWRAKAARETREAARSAGTVAILASQWARVQAMADAIRRQLDAFQDTPRPLSTGRPEQTLVWQEGEVWCRARLDWLHEDRRTVDDLKTTEGTANPDAWTRSLFGLGYDLQAAFYLRGLRALGHEEVSFRFIVVESVPPYGLSVVSLTPAALALADRKVNRALDAWAWCLEHDRWPAYPTRTCYAELPPWIETAWMEREVRDDGRPLSEQLL